MSKKIIARLTGYLPYLVYGLVGTLSILWFRNNDFLVRVDTLFPVRLEFADEYLSYISHRSGFSSPDVIKIAVLFPHVYLLKVWHTLNLPYDPGIFQRLLIYVLFTFTGISAHHLASVSFPRKHKSMYFLSGISYMLSFYLSFLFNALPIFLMFSYTFFPIILAKYVQLLTFGNTKDAVKLALLVVILLLPSYASPPYFLIHLFVLFAYFVFYVWSNKAELKRCLRLSTIALLSFVLFSFHWFYSLIFVNTISIESFRINEADPINTYVQNSSRLLDGFRFVGYFGLGEKYKGFWFSPWFRFYSKPLIIVLSFAPIFLSYSGLFFKRLDVRDKKVYLYYSVLSIVFFSLITLPHQPFYFVWKIVGDKTKFFDFFRTAYQRFSGFLSLSLSLMLGFSTYMLFERVFKTFRFKFYAMSFVGVFLLIYSYPLVSGRIFDKHDIFPSGSVTIPNEYFEVDKYLKDKKTLGNVLVVPYNQINLSSFWWEDGNSGYDGIHPFAHFGSVKYLIGGNGEEFTSAVNSYFKNENANFLPISRLFDVDYVVFHKDYNWKFIQHNNWWVARDPVSTINKLDSDKCLQKEKEFGSLVLYSATDLCNFPKVSTYADKDLVRFYGHYDIIPGIVQSDGDLADSLFLVGDYADEQNVIPTGNSLYVRQFTKEVAFDEAIWSAGWFWPNSSVSPESWKHRLVRLKEAYNVIQQSRETSSYIDALSWRVAKRLVELSKWDLSEEKTEYLVSLIEKDVHEIKLLSRSLYPAGMQEQHVDQLRKVYIYISRGVSEIEDKEVQLRITRMLENLVTDWSLSSKDCEGVCFEVDVVEEGDYALDLDTDMKAYESIDMLLNGSSIGRLPTLLHLNKGRNVFRFSKDIEMPNLVESGSWVDLDSPNTEDSIISWAIVDEFRGDGSSNPQVMEISDWKPNQKYEITFEYRIKSGALSVGVLESVDNYLGYSSNNDVIEAQTSKNTSLHSLKSKRYMDADYEWKNVVIDAVSSPYSYRPTYILVDALYSREGDAEIEVRNIAVREIPSISLIVKNKVETGLAVPPEVERIEKVSESEYKVVLGNVGDEPFFIEFIERCSEGWNIYQLSNSRRFIGRLLNYPVKLGAKLLFQSSDVFNFVKVDAEKVVLQNCTNAWMIEPENLSSNTLYIRYSPQSGLNFTFLISALSVFAAIILLSFKFVKGKINSERL